MIRQQSREEDDMTKIFRRLLPYLAMASIYILVNSLSLLFVNLLRPSEAISTVIAFQDPNDPSNLLFPLGAMFGFTGLILLIRKYRKRSLQIISSVFLVTIQVVMINFFYLVCSVLMLPVPWGITLSVIADLTVTVLLLKHSEWYVIDAVGIIMTVYVTALMGISIGVYVVVILLAILAVYDAISVYKTKHMIDLAGLVIKTKAPLVLFIPRIRGYSLRRERVELEKGISSNEGKREVFLLGLGDLVFPSILVTSSFYFLADGGLLIALSVLLGTLLGFSLLMVFVAKGKPQAGLPFLNSGAILAFFIVASMASR
ncbi:presenilin family intramembrane aspartyl protease, partial [Candidatus Bathyarchaeota archaeon]|nr:presenilin family intramembrane aspartyl protease [Candidatus Bathyarchaeota archaeon]